MCTTYFDQEHRRRIKEEEPKLRRELQRVEKELKRGELTEEERKKLRLEQMTLRVQLDPPGRSFAQFMLDHWKFERHLYDHYGGGRILWQQAGIEAFDAHRKWLEVHEKQGDFKITDPKLRSALFEYWTTMKHGAFLTDDNERIRKEFLEPDWVPQQR